jgi:hypothetical protein
VITAVETTIGAVAENRRMMALAEQAEANAETRPEILVADRKYGTNDNFVAAQQAGYRTHMADLRKSQANVAATDPRNVEKLSFAGTKPSS